MIGSLKPTGFGSDGTGSGDDTEQVVTSVLLLLPVSLPIAAAIRWYIRRVKLENIGEHRWFVRHLKTNYDDSWEGFAKTTGAVAECLIVVIFPAEVLLGAGYGGAHLVSLALHSLGWR